MPQRLQALTHWLETTLDSPGLELRPASSDASFRRYFRFQHGGESFIAMDAPPDKEDTGPFIRVSRLLHGLGLSVPEVLAEDREQGFLLLTDLGTQAYLDVLDTSSVGPLYGDALQALLRMQQGTAQALDLPPFDETRLLQELELFREWYLQRHLGLTLSQQQHEALDQTFDRLIASALAQPQVLVHRDYHSRNLMVLPQGNPGILDFQDAVIGPITYDLVSLLRDCYIAWPQEQVEAWVLAYWRDCLAAGLLVDVSEADWLRWFDWMGLQRHLKVAGIFSRLNLRDGKPGYLNDIPLVLQYLREVSARYGELDSLSRLLETVASA